MHTKVSVCKLLLCTRLDMGSEPPARTWAIQLGLRQGSEDWLVANWIADHEISAGDLHVDDRLFPGRRPSSTAPNVVLQKSIAAATLRHTNIGITTEELSGIGFTVLILSVFFIEKCNGWGGTKAVPG
jgi:hypothetical protein